MRHWEVFYRKSLWDIQCPVGGQATLYEYMAHLWLWHTGANWSGSYFQPFVMYVHMHRSQDCAQTDTSTTQILFQQCQWKDNSKRAYMQNPHSREGCFSKVIEYLSKTYKAVFLITNLPLWKEQGNCQASHVQG